MASTSEVGFAKQLADYEDFLELLSKLGDLYMPPKRELHLINLRNHLTTAKEAMREVSTFLPPYSTAVDKQTLVFSLLNDKITRSLNFYKVCISNPKEIDTAKNLADKIRGVSKKSKSVKDADIPKKNVSQSQLSFDSRIENLKQYIDVLSASGEYATSGSGIDIEDLNSILTDMEATNGSVAAAKLPLEEARNKRYQIFYAPNSGLADLVINVKRYVRATLAKDNPFYNAITGFTFKKR
ncbi:hypothetical protein [Pedobacter aquatilis]|uniref:hypothetical protein n=1 Tax=Pedobacter aquatilis TaxID=351343 RepID=UPI00292E4112|nr:hypothetical protein [Pedobacter aquatilis]